MKKIKLAILTTATVLAINPMQAATFLNKKADWDKLSGLEQLGYVMGVFDWNQVGVTGETLYSYRTDLGNCVVDLGLTSNHMIEIVNSEYSDLSKWDMPPYGVLSDGLRKVCLAHINSARVGRGEAPLE